MLTWLQIVSAATVELGLGAAPTTVALAADDLTRQLGALANRCGDMLARRRAWSMLATEWRVELEAPVTLAGTATSGSAVVTGLPNTAGLTAGIMAVSGDRFPSGTRLASVDSPTQVTLTHPAASGGVVTLTFSRDTYAAPADLLDFEEGTFWDRTRRWQMVGPVSPDYDQAVRSGLTAPQVRRKFRLLGRTAARRLRIVPPPGSDAPASLAFEYQSAHWAMNASGTPQPAFVADTDTCVFDDDLMVMGVKWLFLQSKGMEYAAMREDWLAQVSHAAAADGGAPRIALGRFRRDDWLIGPHHVPDTGFGGVS